MTAFEVRHLPWTTQTQGVYEPQEQSKHRAKVVYPPALQQGCKRWASCLSCPPMLADKCKLRK